jgi:hypothetical protein
MLQAFVDKCTLPCTGVYSTSFSSLKAEIIAFYEKNGAEFVLTDFELANELCKLGLRIDTTYMSRCYGPVFNCILESAFNEEIANTAKEVAKQKKVAAKRKQNTVVNDLS